MAGIAGPFVFSDHALIAALIGIVLFLVQLLWKFVEHRFFDDDRRCGFDIEQAKMVSGISNGIAKHDEIDHQLLNIMKDITHSQERIVDSLERLSDRNEKGFDRVIGVLHSNGTHSTRQ